MRSPATLPKFLLLALLCLAGLGVIGACASQGPRLSVGQQHDQTSKPVAERPSWPKTKIAQRKFSVEAMIVDTRSRPWKLWMISTEYKGAGEAMEFFTGENVKNVHIETGAATAPHESADTKSYSFIDAKGRRYLSVQADPSRADIDQPSIYAGWQQKGRGHDVVLGGYLFENQGASDLDGVYTTKAVPVDPNTFFNGQRACEPMAYVARTQGSKTQDSDARFVQRTRIIADYDTAHACWTTKPVHALDLHDNTFIIATADRVFRINSFDLTPVGAAPELRLIDIKEK
jgi:hypothetical protein